MILNRPYLNLTRLDDNSDKYWQLTISFILDERKRLVDVIDQGVTDGTRNIAVTFYQDDDTAEPDTVNSVTTVQRILTKEEGEKQVYVFMQPIMSPIPTEGYDKKGDTEFIIQPLMTRGEGSTGSYHP